MGASVIVEGTLLYLTQLRDMSISDNNSSLNAQQTSFKNIAILLATLWTLLIFISTGWNLHLINSQIEKLATQEARSNWNKDQSFRRWVTRHGGLYVKPDERTPPNPYLSHLSHRDVETTDGVKLTLMNPAYVMSQLVREYEEMYGIKGRITGQILLNPANKPDAWELTALKQFDKGEEEAITLSDLDGEPFLRLMKPLVMVEGCVSCHGHLGFKLGDIRGGVSISIPLLPYMQAAESNQNALLITHTAVWLLGMMGIFIVSYRSRQQAGALKERDQQLSELLDLTAEGIFVTNQEGRCTLTNSACIELLGYNSETEIIGKDTHALLHHTHKNGSQYDEEQCLIYKSFRTNTKTHTETEIFWRSDGSSFPVEYWSYPIVRDGEVTGSFVTFVDITERLKSEQMLRRSQKMDALGQLTGGIAHDFNNQLGIVTGYMELLNKHLSDDKKARDWITASSKATDRCITLTRQLLNFSRQQQTNIELIDLQAEYNELKELIQRTVTPAVEVSSDIAEDLWKIKTSRGDLDDALLNLVINSRDAMPDGGMLSITMYNKSIGQDNDKQLKAGDYVVITVTDSGSGIAIDIQEHVFDPFFTTKEIGKGTGLGMPMVYAFVKRNQGSINLISEPGEGTSIIMYLPRATSDNIQRQNQSTVKTDEAKGNDETILVVEDEESLRELAINILSANGYRTIQAKNGNEAEEILRGNEYIDILFSDIIMPGGMTGLQLAKIAKELRPDLKILLTTGCADEDLENGGRFEDREDILQKPYRHAELIKSINKLLEK